MKLLRDVQRFQLDNGLTLLLKEVHSAPVISFWIWYRVGSRNEVPGITGVSHWVEHMQFKGSKRFPAGTYDRLFSHEGGVFNAMTWMDYTAFFETLPADKILLSLDVESDRMVNSLFDPEEVASERSVIISERSMYENQPPFLLSEEVQNLAIKAHPYHHEVIGWLSDLQTMTRDDLYNHYRRYYAPNNAVAVAVGDFQMGEMVAAIERYFGPLPAQPLPPQSVVQEPPQRGERRVTLRGAGQVVYVNLAFQAPPAKAEDYLPMVVLDGILSGAKSVGGQSVATGRSARIYRSLVSSGIAVEAGSWFTATLDPFLFFFSATVAPEHPAEEVENAFWREIDRMRNELVSLEELTKVLKQSKAQFIYSNESVTSQARWLGFSEVIASTEWFDSYLDRLAAVTAADVQRVAQTYLQREKCTVGYYLPERAQQEETDA